MKPREILMSIVLTACITAAVIAAHAMITDTAQGPAIHGSETAETLKFPPQPAPTQSLPQETILPASPEQTVTSTFLPAPTDNTTSVQEATAESDASAQSSPAKESFPNQEIPTPTPNTSEEEALPTPTAPPTPEPSEENNPPEETLDTLSTWTEEPAIWVLIDISDQHLYLYRGEELVLESPVVTGNAKGHGTPTGTFTLDYKIRNKTLKGFNDDGSKYASFVNYWMPFNGGIGLHDATWRSSREFGGNTYQYNGSHGCVNMPWEKAKQTYELLSVGDKIVVQD